MDSSLNQEQRVLIIMRKVLAQIIKDATPTAPGMRHPLREQTIQMIRECFMLIAERERLLYEQEGKENAERPYYTDDPAKPEVISFDHVKKKHS